MTHHHQQKPKSNKMGEIKMQLRRDIKLDQRFAQEYQDEHVTIFAFEWMKEGLKRIQKLLDQEVVIVNVANSIKYYIDGGNLTLKDLQIIARNESSNTSGLINFENYNGIRRELIYSLKDLNRQTVIVGRSTVGAYFHSLNVDILPGRQRYHNQLWWISPRQHTNTTSRTGLCL